MEQQQGIDAPQHESFVHHPVHATVEEATHLRQVAAQGESPATPAILIAAVLAFVVPLAAILMVLAFGIAHFA